MRNLVHEKYNLIVFRWYNIPYSSSKEKAKTPDSTKVASAEAPGEAAAAEEEDSAPLDFDTFVPSYDPSLPVPSEAPAAPESSFFIPAPSTTMVSRDEAFSRALSAMYWGGYWTAVYHVSSLRACTGTTYSPACLQCQNQQSSQEVLEEQDHQEHEESDEEALEADTEDLVPTQR